MAAGVGQPKKKKRVFHVSRMREKHRENRQMRKTDESRLLCASAQTLPLQCISHYRAASRHSHLSFPQMCLTPLITVASVFEGWSHQIYLYDYETGDARCKWCLSVFFLFFFFFLLSRLHRPRVAHRRVFECLWLLSSAHLPLLTGICDESLLNNGEKTTPIFTS